MTKEYIKKLKKLLKSGASRILNALTTTAGIILTGIIWLAIFIWNPALFPAIIRGAVGGTITSVVTAVCFLNMGLTYDWVIPISIGFFILSFVFLYLEKEENQEPNH